MSGCLFELIKVAQCLAKPVLGFPGSIAEYNDLDALSDQLQLGSRLGAVGAFCIHPKQVAAANKAYSVRPGQVGWAEGVMLMAEEVERNGVAVHPIDGQMIDAPVVKRAIGLVRVRSRVR